MKYFVLVILMLSAVSVWAQEQVIAQEQATSKQEDIDVEGLLANVKNPFESRLPPPPPPPVPVNNNSGSQVEIVPSFTNPNGVIETIVQPVPIERPALSVQGLVWSEKINSAIINGQVLGIGDEINGAKIRRVSREGVTVLYRGKKFTYEIQ